MKQLNALDLFTIGIGPSSSHTVGPMRAAKLFAEELAASNEIEKVTRVKITLYGSLASTGVGHGTTNALIAGLEGLSPESCDPNQVLSLWEKAKTQQQIHLLGKQVAFQAEDLVLESKVRQPKHSNAMTFEGLDASQNTLLQRQYYSVGGGFVEGDEEELEVATNVPYPFSSAEELLKLTDETNLSIADLVRANVVAQMGQAQVDQKLTAVWRAMESCVEAGLTAEGTLPGYLQVKRRAAAMATTLKTRQESEPAGELTNEWLQAYAIAVNEENAAGQRVVTAPTNGAAGIIPAVGYYAQNFKNKSRAELASTYLLTAAGIGTLYKLNASISGAEAGCQGEVGSACSMAAAGLAALLGGTPRQIENAAEIAMEHNLGLTCDPVGGFVQLPCIERNAIAAGTAVSAVRLALMGDGSHKISLDTVIETMRQTGIDMSSKYKETSMGGLALNVVEC